MLPEEAIYTFLVSQPEINKIVEDRIYPMLMPQDSKLPAITYQRISTVRKHILQAPSDFSFLIFQFNCWSDKYSESKILADNIIKIVQEISQFEGIQAVLPMGELDRYEPDTKSYCVDIEVEFHYIESSQGG